jgi:hypothetical protein
MFKVFFAVVMAIAGVLLVGLLNLSIANMAVILVIPFVFIFKLFGDRPLLFAYATYIGVLAGGVSMFHGYILVPIQYYYGIWGWGGVAAGVVAAILLPLEAVLFLVTAYIKGGSGHYVGQFLGGICFGIAALLVFLATMQKSVR